VIGESKHGTEERKPCTGNGVEKAEDEAARDGAVSGTVPAKKEVEANAAKREPEVKRWMDGTTTSDLKHPRRGAKQRTKANGQLQADVI
jgi:hypothetical protein